MSEQWRVSISGGVRLETANRIIRMHPHEYREYRDHLYWLMFAGLDRRPPPKPLQRCKIHAEMRRKRLVDVDGKYGCLKPVIDILQPHRTYGRTSNGGMTAGLGVIADDSDGEGEASGVIQEYRVFQRKVPARDEGLDLLVVGL